MNDQPLLAYRALGKVEPCRETEDWVNLIELIYIASRHRRQWREVLAALAQSFNGVAAFIVHHDLCTSFGRILFQHGLSGSFVRDYSSGDNQVCALFWDLFAACSPGSMHRDADILQRANPPGAAAYEHLKREAGIGNSMIGKIGISPHRLDYLCVGRGVGAGEFDAADVAKATMLLPHIAQALAIFFQLANCKCLEQGTMLALNQLPYGMIIVGRDGRPIAQNDIARELIERGDGIRSGANGLELMHRGTTLSAKELLAGQKRPAPDDELADAGNQTLLVARRRTERPLCVTVLPLDVETEMGSDERGGLVCVVDPERPNGVNVAFLRRAFGLTPAEARVAELIVNGGRLCDAADVLGITVGTARTHLKRIFSKTGAFSQADLVRLAVSYSIPGASPNTV